MIRAQLQSLIATAVSRLADTRQKCYPAYDINAILYAKL